MKIYSFDVFDTLLLRNNKSEAFRFFEISKCVTDFLNDSGYLVSSLDVLIARFLSTETTYRFSEKVHGCREGSLEEIYKGICTILKVDTDLWRQALQLEIEYEKQNTSFNFELWNKIRDKAIEENAKLILISDIYMQGQYIEQILLHHKPDLFDECNKLYSSADYTVSKASGHLFDIASNDFDVNPQDCLHMGDNFTTDYKNPKIKNWNAEYLPIDDDRKLRIKENFFEIREYLRSKNIIIPQIERAARGYINEI